MRRTIQVLLSVSLLGISGLRAAESLPSGGEETVQVTATRIPEVAENLPTIVSVLDGEMLRERGMTDLRSALGVVAGVDIAPGGDGGPASAVPEMWGLREFDAFLLVVDGVPWGGAFNPDLPTLSLRDVARIEVMRGSAPVMYGATSFVGVIHVIHNTAGSGHGEGQVMFGDHSSVGISAAIDVAHGEGFSSRIGVDWTEQGYPDERTEWERAHVLWRNRMAAGGGHVRLDVDLHWLDQSPASPAPRVGPELSPLVPIDANVNPLGSHIDPRRQTLTLGYEHAAGYGSWEATASFAHRSQDALRGFLAADPDSASLLTAAHGFRQTTSQDEWYLDGHMNFTHNPKIVVVAGADLLYGDARAHGGDFDYEVNYDGTSPPDGTVIPNAADVNIGDTRTFGGLYGYAVWTPQWRWRLDAGLRANFTHETRDTSELEFDAPPAVIGSDSRSENRVSGGVGASFTIWKDKDDTDDVKMFAGYRNTFKPAAIEFEPDPEILEPEEGQSYEIGARAALLDHKLELELDVFQMDLKDIVVAEEGGTPGIENGGEQRLRGAELEVRGRLTDGLWARFAWSYHQAKFEDFTQDFGAGPQQLAGNRLEMSPEHMGALGVIWAPKSGFTAHGEVRYTGDRYLNRRNTALADGFTSWSAGIGWRFRSFEVRIDGENLSDARDPVSESELGDGQYYRLPARQIWVSGNWTF